MAKKLYTSVQPIIKRLLTDHDKTRDDDVLLYGDYVNDVIQNDRALALSFGRMFICLDSITAKDLLDLTKRGVLANYDIITRARRKIQEEHPALRGTVWNIRHNIEEPKVQADLGYPSKLERDVHGELIIETDKPSGYRIPDKVLGADGIVRNGEEI